VEGNLDVQILGVLVAALGSHPHKHCRLVQGLVELERLALRLLLLLWSRLQQGWKAVHLGHHGLLLLVVLLGMGGLHRLMRELGLSAGGVAVLCTARC
jgi:hypothetical protein